MAVNSRNKGKRGELQIAHILNDHGYKARRGQQYSGASGDADVIGIPGIHIEVKYVQALNIEKAMEQSRNDARIGEIPIVMHRKNHEPWKVTMDIGDWIKFLKAYENHNKKEI